MSLLLRNGDYVFDERDGFLQCGGAEALMERVLFKLQARRSGCVFFPELGSRLYRLAQEKSTQRLALAKEYVEEALRAEQDLQVDALSWDEARALLTVQLRWQGEERPLILKLHPGGS